MSDPHHDPIEENIDTHPVKVAIGVVIGAVALVVGIILLAKFAEGAYGQRSLKNDSAMQPDRVAERIAPVAKVAIDPNAPAPAPAVPAAPAEPTAKVAVTSPAPSGGTAAGPGEGKKVFDSVCTVCHKTGMIGAPKFGDKAAWAPRIAQGKDKLYQSALEGKNAMPPKGGNAQLSDAEVKAAVDYMVAAAK